MGPNETKLSDRRWERKFSSQQLNDSIMPPCGKPKVGSIMDALAGA